MRIVDKVSVKVTSLAATAVLVVGLGAGSAQAASQLQYGNCNYNLSSGANSLVVRAPKIWSNNGGAQSVRYRSLLEKWNASEGRWRLADYGQWHTGTATPSTAYVDAARTWSLNGYGRGSYTVQIQVQYLSGGVWGGTESRWLWSYYRNYYYSGAWHLEGTSSYCSF